MRTRPWYVPHGIKSNESVGVMAELIRVYLVFNLPNYTFAHTLIRSTHSIAKSPIHYHYFRNLFIFHWCCRFICSCFSIHTMVEWSILADLMRLKLLFGVHRVTAYGIGMNRDLFLFYFSIMVGMGFYVRIIWINCVRCHCRYLITGAVTSKFSQNLYAFNRLIEEKKSTIRWMGEWKKNVDKFRAPSFRLNWKFDIILSKCISCIRV